MSQEFTYEYDYSDTDDILKKDTLDSSTSLYGEEEFEREVAI